MIQGHGAGPTQLPKAGAKDVGILSKAGDPGSPERESGCAHLQAGEGLC